MSKKHHPGHRDKRSKLDLELFVLALIHKEINTPYRLHSAGGISLGASIPALSRLEKAGYVRPGKPGTRGRIEYEITVSGKRYLKSGWQPLLEAAVPTDVDAVLRIASVAMLSGADKETVAVYLTRAATMKVPVFKQKNAAAVKAEASLPAVRETGLYAWLQATHKATRLAAEAKLLRQLASAILRCT